MLELAYTVLEVAAFVVFTCGVLCTTVALVGAMVAAVSGLFMTYDD